MAMVVMPMNALTHHDRMCLDLASALCARLCHDISSPLGTLSGTLELAKDEPEHAEEALALAGESAAFMISRLQLLRAAWAGDCGPMNSSRLADLAAGLPSRVKAELDDLSPGPFASPLARVLLNLLLLGAEALPMGGVVALSGEPASGIILTVVGRSVRWDAGLAGALLDPTSAPATDPRMVQMPLTARLAHAAGLRLSFLAAVTHGPSSAPRLLLAPA
jgi:histidine phosphotransferase ChpT